MARAAASASPSNGGVKWGASAASAWDRVLPSPIARAASSASRRAWSRSVGPRWGASAASAWDRVLPSPIARAAASASAG